MGTLENIVRPFQLPDTTPPTVVPFATPTKVAAVVKLRIGRAGNVKTFNSTLNVSGSLYVKKYPRELTTLEQGLIDLNAQWEANMTPSFDLGF